MGRVTGGRPLDGDEGHRYRVFGTEENAESPIQWGWWNLLSFRDRGRTEPRVPGRKGRMDGDTGDNEEGKTTTPETVPPQGLRRQTRPRGGKDEVSLGH